MDSNTERNVGRQSPVSESVSVPAPRELQPTPVVTLTSTMVLRSHKREGRSFAEKSEPEVVSRPAEVEISAPLLVAGEFGSAGPEIQRFQLVLVAQRKQETVLALAFPARPETPAKTTAKPKPPPM